MRKEAEGCGKRRKGEERGVPGWERTPNERNKLATQMHLGSRLLSGISLPVEVRNVYARKINVLLKFDLHTNQIESNQMY